MYKYLLSLVFLVHLTTSLAQEYFFLQDTILGHANFAYGIERYGENYVVGGIVSDSSFQRQMFMALYDAKGQLVHYQLRPEVDKILAFDFNDEIVVESGKAIWHSIGTGVAIIYEYHIEENTFSKVDTFLTHPVTGEEGFTCYDFAGIENGYFMTGNFTEEFTDSDIGLYKVTADSIFKFRITDPDNSSYGIRIFENTDNSYTVVCFHESCNRCRHLRVLRFDSDLNMLDDVIGPDTVLKSRMIDALLDDEGAVVACSLNPIINDTTGVTWVPLISKMSANGRIYWDAIFGETENDNFLESNWAAVIEATDDDGYIVAGSARINTPESDYSYATLAKVSSEGDSVWYRRYSVIDTTHAYHSFTDVTDTPEGGYMAVGFDYCYSRYTGCDALSRILLLKTDNKGLIVPDSGSNVVTVDPAGLVAVSSYPNPVVSTLYIQHSAREHIDYKIMDIQGRVRQSFSAGLIDETFIIDVTDYPSGAYYLSYSDAQGRPLGTELIVRK